MLALHQPTRITRSTKAIVASTLSTVLNISGDWQLRRNRTKLIENYRNWVAETIRKRNSQFSGYCIEAIWWQLTDSRNLAGNAKCLNKKYQIRVSNKLHKFNNTILSLIRFMSQDQGLKGEEKKRQLKHLCWVSFEENGMHGMNDISRWIYNKIWLIYNKYI